MLEEANIPHTFFEYKEDIFGYQIILNDNIYVVQDQLSYGHDNDQLEIVGALTKEEQEQRVQYENQDDLDELDEDDEDNSVGYLTAEEAFKRLKYCYEHNTTTYVEE